MYTVYIYVFSLASITVEQQISSYSNLIQKQTQHIDVSLVSTRVFQGMMIGKRKHICIATTGRPVMLANGSEAILGLLFNVPASLSLFDDRCGHSLNFKDEMIYFCRNRQRGKDTFKNQLEAQRLVRNQLENV